MHFPHCTQVHLSTYTLYLFRCVGREKKLEQKKMRTPRKGSHDGDGMFAFRFFCWFENAETVTVI